MYSYLKLHSNTFGIILLATLCYWSFGYDLSRADPIKLLSLVGALFFFTHKIYQWERHNFWLLFGAGLLFRGVLIGSTPMLSQDFYRYIWDGQLLINNINPYLHTPNELIEHWGNTLPNAEYLYKMMGALSQKHYSNYPPISQYLYALVAFVGQGSIPVAIVAFKLIILLADIGVLYFMQKIAAYIGAPKAAAFWYFLNPLVVLELSGNLHLEGLMIVCFLAGIYGVMLLKKGVVLGALGISLGIMTKLIPILFIPFLLLPLGLKKWMRLGVWILLFCGLLLWPLLGHGFFDYYLQTIGLWFNNFEFNASFYNLIKGVSKAFGYSGYRTILTYGKVLPVLIVLLALGVFTWQYLQSYRNLKVLAKTGIGHKVLLLLINPTGVNLEVPNYKIFQKKVGYPLAFAAMLFMVTGYLFIATTVHPWYLIFGVALSVFTPYTFMRYWSVLVFLSYITYSHPSFKENMWVLAVEYLSVFAVFGYEIVKIKWLTFHSVKKTLKKN